MNSPCFALRFIHCTAFNGAFALTNQRCMTKFHSFFTGGFLVLNKTFFDKILFTNFFLLGLKIGSVSGVTFFAVTMLARDYIVVFGFFNHHNFVNAPFSSSGNGANVQG